MTDAFGVVALVALTPLIAVQLMGLACGRRAWKEELSKIGESIPEDADTIVEIMED